MKTITIVNHILFTTGGEGYQKYETAKKALLKLCLSPSQYEEAVQIITKKIKI